LAALISLRSHSMHSAFVTSSIDLPQPKTLSKDTRTIFRSPVAQRIHGASNNPLKALYLSALLRDDSV
jgi:hypothetical protein